MKNKFLKVSEAPKTKLQLKKAILNGSIIVFEKNMSWNTQYEIVNNVECLLKIWDGFRYSPKFQDDNNEACAYLGTSFYYKFTKKVA